MAKNKFYVVWKGLNPGIYDNWAECKAQVDQRLQVIDKGHC